MNNKYIIYVLTVCFYQQLQAEVQDSLALLHYNLGALRANPAVAVIPRECGICYTEQTNFLQLACGHEYCIPCLEQTAQGAFERERLQDIRCPNPECVKAMQPKEIAQLLTAAQRPKYLDLQQQTDWIKRRDDKDIKENILKCPTVGCALRFQRTAAPQQKTCKDCKATYCASCATVHPAGAVTCAGAKALLDRLTQEAEYKKSEAQRKEEEATKKAIKPCPKCGAPTVKDEGCKWVTCDQELVTGKKCNFGFCWACLKGPLRTHEEHECTVAGFGWGVAADQPHFFREAPAPVAAVIQAGAQQVAHNFLDAIRVPAGQPVLGGLRDLFAGDLFAEVDAIARAREAAAKARLDAREAERKVRDDAREAEHKRQRDALDARIAAQRKRQADAEEAVRKARDDVRDAERKRQEAKLEVDRQARIWQEDFNARERKQLAGAGAGAGAAGEYKRVAADEDVAGDLDLAFEEIAGDVELQKAIEESMKQ